MGSTTREGARLTQADRGWRLWGPYQAARQWGTVREDYSADGDAWAAFPFEQASSRAYRWGEDGIAGLCDSHGFLHLALALWNGHDERLKERFFGLTNAQGNHGEDVKEYWWPLDATPTHSWGSLLYRYPQAAYPYRDLVEQNAARGRDVREYELADTGVLDGDRFFDVVVSHAKADVDDVLVTIEATNRGPDPATIHLVPQLWFRNTWAWGRDDRTPVIEVADAPDDAAPGHVLLRTHHDFLGDYELHAEGDPEVLVCDNETDVVGLWGAATPITPVPEERRRARGGARRPHRDPRRRARHQGGPAVDARARARGDHHGPAPPARRPPRGGRPVRRVRRRARRPPGRGGRVLRRHPADGRRRHRPRHRATGVRRACCGASRSTGTRCASGSRATPPSPPHPRSAAPPGARNVDWAHLELADVISMPDDWEYPWFAAWDLAFHAVTLAHVDPAFAKEQLLLMCREWVQHPAGQLPAYEWEFSDVNPPVHAWAAWQVYLIDGARDRVFLGTVLSKLLLNVSWWLNRKDVAGNDLYTGGFLGMDNISLFDRSKDVPPGHRLEQSDATSWVAFAFLSMLRMAQELARHDPTWEELATTFLERFLAIAEATEAFGTSDVRLWDEEDGFFYDVLVDDAGHAERVRVRSLVGLVPLLAVALEPHWVATDLPGYTGRRGWIEEHRADLLAQCLVTHPDATNAGTLALVDPDRWRRLLGPAPGPGRVLVRPRGAVAVGRVPGRRDGRPRGPRAAHRVRPRPPRARGCSAGTPTGAARCGCRSTRCSSTPCTPTPTARAATCASSCPPAAATRPTCTPWRTTSPNACWACSGRAATAADRATPPTTRPARCGRTRPSASTSTATPAPGSARATRPAGRPWSPT